VSNSSEQPPSHTISGVGDIPTEEELGAPSAYEPAQEEGLAEGYLEQLANFRTATQLGDDQDGPRKTFIPLFAALAFAASLIERVLEPKDKGRAKKPIEERDLTPLQGVRYVRNRVQHQWAVALRGEHVPQARILQAGPQIFEPAVMYDWFWKPLSELPEPPPDMPKDELGWRSYEKYLAEQPARLTLDAIETILSERRGSS
jgi:hypothetical protein